MKKAFGCVCGLLLLFVGCNTVDCPMNNTVYTTYQLLRADGSVDTLKDSLTIITMQKVANQDPVIVNRGINLSELIVPISYDGDEDVFYYFFKDSTGYYAIDTVWVEKTNHPHFESVDCNPSYFHTLTGVHSTHHMIDSLVINNPQVNYDASKTHILLYLHSLD